MIATVSWRKFDATFENIKVTFWLDSHWLKTRVLVFLISDCCGAPLFKISVKISHLILSRRKVTSLDELHAKIWTELWSGCEESNTIRNFRTQSDLKGERKLSPSLSFLQFIKRLKDPPDKFVYKFCGVTNPSLFWSRKMGTSDSKEKENSEDNLNSSSKESEVPSTILPLNKTVCVHLVPKFYTSEERGFKRSYCLLVTLQTCVNLHRAIEQWHHSDLTASVEFHERRFVESRTCSSFRFSGNRPLTVKSILGSDITVTQVTLKENDSLRITGVFKRNIGSIEDLTTCDAFDLILCPSFRINSQNSDWFLLGTLYTKHADFKHRRHWRAAVRADYTWISDWSYSYICVTLTKPWKLLDIMRILSFIILTPAKKLI